ncbi:MAG: glycosyltransferase family 4 protein [Halothece sp.]
MKILMLSTTFPYPPTKGETQVRTFNLMKYLSQSHEVTLVTQRNESVTDAEVEGLKQEVAELVIFPPAASQLPEGGLLGKAKRLKIFLQEGTPPSVLSNYSPQMQQWISEAVKGNAFDVLTSEHSINEIYVQPQWHDSIKTVVNIHSSVYGSCKHQLETQISENGLRDKINLPLLRRYEERYCSKFSSLVVTTDVEKRQLKAMNPEFEISIIPNGVDLLLFPKRSSDPGGQRLVFIGAMDNAANIDAVRFFSLEVFPEIRSRYGKATLDLVGARPVAEVQALGEMPGIRVTGSVPSMVEYLHGATVCVVPMRTGLGIKNKTLEAMAAGIPVVASDRGLEGLTVDGADVPLRAMRANDVDEYVYSIGRLFEDASLRSKLSENGRSLIEKDYTWERVGKRYEQVLM